MESNISSHCISWKKIQTHSVCRRRESWIFLASKGLIACRLDRHWFICGSCWVIAFPSLVFFPLFSSPFKLSLSPIKVLLDKFSHFYFFTFSLLVEVGTGGREQLCGWCSGSTHITKHIVLVKDNHFHVCAPFGMWKDGKRWSHNLCLKMCGWIQSCSF